MLVWLAEFILRTMEELESAAETIKEKQAEQEEM